MPAVLAGSWGPRLQQADKPRHSGVGHRKLSHKAKHCQPHRHALKCSETVSQILPCSFFHSTYYGFGVPSHATVQTAC